MKRYRIRHNSRPWALRKQTDSKPHENEAKILRGANCSPGGSKSNWRPFRAPIARRTLIVLRPLIVRNSYFCVFTYVQSKCRGKVMLCTLHTYKYAHITVLKSAENWKVQQSVTIYAVSIDQNKVVHSQWFPLEFRNCFLHSLF